MGNRQGNDRPGLDHRGAAFVWGALQRAMRVTYLFPTELIHPKEMILAARLVSQEVISAYKATCGAFHPGQAHVA